MTWICDGRRLRAEDVRRRRRRTCRAASAPGASAGTRARRSCSRRSRPRGRRDLVAEAEEDVLDLAADLRDRVQVAERQLLARERDVDHLLAQPPVELGALELVARARRPPPRAARGCRSAASRSRGRAPRGAPASARSSGRGSGRARRRARRGRRRPRSRLQRPPRAPASRSASLSSVPPSVAGRRSEAPARDSEDYAAQDWASCAGVPGSSRGRINRIDPHARRSQTGSIAPCPSTTRSPTSTTPGRGASSRTSTSTSRRRERSGGPGRRARGRHRPDRRADRARRASP